MQKIFAFSLLGLRRLDPLHATCISIYLCVHGYTRGKKNNEKKWAFLLYFFRCPFFFPSKWICCSVTKKDNKINVLVKEKQASWGRRKEEWIKIYISQRTGGQEKAHESQSNFIQLGPGKSKPARSSETVTQHLQKPARPIVIGRLARDQCQGSFYSFYY